ncbi:ABC transporter ATP-binding protein [Pararhizobium sp. IMCC21322]|uniref:ABC transporter ATP-binding protein n=1 Tax=Pararhizobium sp. IMCC21322 TaxID=3067903 RepID=UPI002741CA4D|nr:sn-glycerol-3-phosphate ABC transporter ATP-binding protein UgpC [Pararhizobium sp. IMCC21322]
MASVIVEKLVKKYGDLEVLHSIDLDVEDGQFVVLLGPSGCGKSTLLRTIAGLESSTSGDISIGDRRVNGVHPKDRNIAMVFQNYALYAHMKVRDNMAFSMQLSKTPKARIEERVNWAASILSLEPYLDRYPKELSGGQRQRVAMGRAIVRDPDVFLFDEPLSNLDAKLRVQMRTEIKELHQRLKTTTVYVTHDQIEAMTMADIVVIMRDGHIEQMGTPMEIYDNPSNLFVAEFIGSPGMNLLKGKIIEEGGKMVCRVNELHLPLPDQLDVTVGQTVLYGIRPEHLIPSETGLKATISVVEPTGPETHLFCHLSGHDVCAISRERMNWKADEVVSLEPIVDYVHVFDAQTDQAIKRKM